MEPKFNFKSGVTVDAKINQDRGGIQYPFANRDDVAFFCVMDGHGRGGEKVSEFCMQNLPRELEQHPELFTDTGKAFVQSFNTVDQNLRAVHGSTATYAGTTVVAVLMIGNELIIANAGDSRAVMGAVHSKSGKTSARDLSFDHKPDSPEEKKRIIKMGGFVSPGSPERGESPESRKPQYHNTTIPGLTSRPRCSSPAAPPQPIPLQTAGLYHSLPSLY